MYNLCPKCELNYVEKENEICDVCKKALSEPVDDEEVFLCEECGAILKPWEITYCKFCQTRLQR